MSSIMQVAIGQRKLVRQLLSDNPSALLQLVSDELEQGSRLRLSSPDAEINAYFSYIADHPFDDLPQTDHDLVMRVRSIRGLSALLEMDRRILIGNPNAVLFNVSNNVLFLACDAWYQPGIYDQIRQNYDYITGQLGKVNSQRLQRIEVYSCCKMIAESPASRMWLLLHLWEEAIINGTTVFVADVDEASGSIRDELVDLDIQLISDGNGQTRLFKHTSEFQILERPDGRYPVNTISEMYDKLQDTQMRMIRRRVTVEVLRRLCVEWKDEALSTELQRWEAAAPAVWTRRDRLHPRAGARMPGKRFGDLQQRFLTLQHASACTDFT